MMNDYSLFKEGDLVVAQDLEDSHVGIVTGITPYKSVIVFWAHAGTSTKHSKKWAELHLGVLGASAH